MTAGSFWRDRRCEGADLSRTITQLPVFGSIEAPVKAEATSAGRGPSVSEAP